MALLFRVGFQGECREIELLGEGRYLVRTVQECVVDIFDDTAERPVSREASTFERALAEVRGWEQGSPQAVDPSIADAVTAALVTRETRTSSGWQRWLKTGELEF